MKTYKIIAINLLLTLILIFSLIFPLLLSKLKDKQLLGKVSLQQYDAIKNINYIQNEATNYTIIDKLKLLYGVRIKSDNIVVIQNSQLSSAEQERIKTAYKTELLKLSAINLLPDLETDMNNPAEISTFTYSSTLAPDLTANFYMVKLNSAAYTITFTMDAETNKIYAFDINSSVEPLTIDFSNADSLWQNYIGLPLWYVPQNTDNDETTDDTYIDNEMQSTLMNEPITENNSNDQLATSSQIEESDLLNATASDYTDGNQIVSFSFYVGDNCKKFSIRCSFN
ncbi:MAG: hypothetical protein H2184_10570 [Candidatus Galacturonibacter soehngenii]|nr:hypothetical protein [Candidatus Galacturonibacter soehngenii]